MRPLARGHYIGQEHLLEKGLDLFELFGRPERRGSWIFWGPPGCGKTTLAELLASETRAPLHRVPAVNSGVADIRKAISDRSAEAGTPLLFIDEIHRLGKVQQDTLLPFLEDGRAVLIGATTENPYKELTGALLSRCRVVRLEPLSQEDIRRLLRRALSEPNGLGEWDLEVEDEVLARIALNCRGDARTALNLLELAVARGTYAKNGGIHVTVETLDGLLNDQAWALQTSSDRRYDLVSALIKSIRGSDPDAALIWLAELLRGGEDPNYLFRRLLISASEDVGLADPSALTVVVGCSQAFDRVGLPEGLYHLSQATLYLATAAKSDSTAALHKAQRYVKSVPPLEVPLHLRDGTFRGSREHGFGVGYLNPHTTPNAQSYLPKSSEGIELYKPRSSGYEKVIQQRLQQYRPKGES